MRATACWVFLLLVWPVSPPEPPLHGQTRSDAAKAAPADQARARAGTPAVPLRFDRYYTYAQVGEALQALHEAYPALTTLEVVGKSEEGRDIWAMTVNNPKTGAPHDKPGVYADANIHGNEIQGGEVCLSLLDTLLTRYGQNDQITRLVDRNAFYVIPVVNVDGRYHFLEDPNDSSSSRSLRIPRDDDRDGLVDEDKPDDLDGDGNICMMRRRDPFGQWKTDPEEPRLMVRAKPGEKGEWTILGDEGTDKDGDGKLNEDPEGYVDGNRNWGYNWAPPYVEGGSGDYPFQGLGIRAIARFLVNHPNIIVVFAFHNSGGMWLRGPSVKAEEPLNPLDIAVYDILGKNAEKIVPGYRYMVSWKDLYPTYGDFTDFTDNIMAAYSLVGELYMAEQETYRPTAKEGVKPPAPPEDEADMFGSSPEAERERLKFSDNLAQGELFKPWKPFKHPQFGEIEIGGWVKMSSRLPHPFMLPDLVHRSASAVIFAASQTPDVGLEIQPAEQIGNDLYKVRVRVTNKGSIPTMTFNAVQKKIYPQDTLKVSGGGIRVISGGLASGLFDDVTYKAYKPEVQFLQVPGNSRVDLQFLLAGKGEATFSYESRKAGKVSKSVTIR
jgi:hypothetical protein